MLHDFSFQTPDELLAGLTNPTAVRPDAEERHGQRHEHGASERMGAMNMDPAWRWT